MRRIAEAARKGLMALYVQVGLAVRQATTENEVAKGGGEVRLESDAWAQQEDSLNEAVLARLLHGVATRSHAATLEDAGEVEAFGTSKSPAGQRFLR